MNEIDSLYQGWIAFQKAVTNSIDEPQTGSNNAKQLSLNLILRLSTKINIHEMGVMAI